MRVAAAIVDQLPRRIDLNGTGVQVSVSIGIALLPDDAATPSDAMQCADAALYQSKRNGKDNYARFSHALGEAQRLRLRSRARPARRHCDRALSRWPTSRSSTPTANWLRSKAWRAGTIPTAAGCRRGSSFR